MNRDLWEKQNYTSTIDFIVGNLIREYDISKANISVLLDQNLITEKQYQYFLALPKQRREYEVGLLQRDNPTIRDGIKTGISEAKRLFLQNNGLDIGDILSIRSDAVYVIGNKNIRTNTVSPHVTFRLANEYTSFYRLNHIEVYYGYFPIKGTEVFDVKGINDETLKLHTDYMIDFMCSIFYCAQEVSIKETIDNLKKFYMDYVSMNLDIGFYRRFDSTSMYDIKDITKNQYGRFQAYFLPPIHKNMVSIEYNEEILRILQKIYSTIYFNSI